jgi:hypothetical protein
VSEPTSDDAGTTDPANTDTQRSAAFRENQRKLEERAKRADEAEARAVTAERRLAFLEAGVDPNKPGAAWFIKGYDGDLSVEAVKAEAAKAGFLREAPAQQVTQQQPPGVVYEGVVPAEAPWATQRAAIGQIDAATGQPVTAPVNYLEGMVKALNSRPGREGIEAMADYMKSVGLPVADQQ